jgi:hypothetical protein
VLNRNDPVTHRVATARCTASHIDFLKHIQAASVRSGIILLKPFIAKTSTASITRRIFQAVTTETRQNCWELLPKSTTLC